MIVTNLVPKQGVCTLTVESPEDLWTLRRLIAAGDTIVTKSSRVVKHEGEYTRPDKGERIRVTVALAVDAVSLDNSIERLRIKGRIVEASDEVVSKVGSHSLVISPGQELTIKKRDWTPLHTNILRSSSRKSENRFLLVAIDRREAGIGMLSGSHLSMIASVESGASGKGPTKEVDLQPFYRRVIGIVKGSWREGDKVVVAGPGNTKLTFENHLRNDPDLRDATMVVEGFDLAGADGVRSLVKFEGFRKVAGESLLVETQETVEEAIRGLSRGERRVAYTLQRVREAALVGAVEKCVVSDDVFAHGVDQDSVVETLNMIEEKGGKVLFSDSSLEMGKQVSSLGGMVALLRYDFRAS